MKALAYGIVTALCVLALAALLSGPTIRERQQTARNVTRLIQEAETNRELVCLIALRDPQAVAWDNRRIVEICLDVGVMP